MEPPNLMQQRAMWRRSSAQVGAEVKHGSAPQNPALNSTPMPPSKRTPGKGEIASQFNESKCRMEVDAHAVADVGDEKACSSRSPIQSRRARVRRLPIPRPRCSGATTTPDRYHPGGATLSGASSGGLK